MCVEGARRELSLISLLVSPGVPSGGCCRFYGHSHRSSQGGLLPYIQTPFPTQPVLPLPRCCGQNSELGPDTCFATSGCLLPHRFLGLQLNFLTQASLPPDPAASKALDIVMQRAKPEPCPRVELPRGTAAASCQNRAGEHEVKPGGSLGSAGRAEGRVCPPSSPGGLLAFLVLPKALR